MKNKDGIELTGGKVSFSKMIAIYLFVCVAGILISLPIFNNLIRQHDLDMASNVCNLIAEKMNNSIAYMTESVKNNAILLGTHSISDMNGMYEEMIKSTEQAEYSSIGIIDTNNKIYCSEPERREIEKWGLLELTDIESGVSISEPYRSSINGKMVITMFSPIYNENVRLGTLFVTYPLEVIQKMANTNVLKDQTEIFLMNPYSDNFIRCSGAEDALIGSWNNMRLYRGDIKDIRGSSYDDWEKAMRDKEKRASVSFEIDDVLYTQVFEDIEAMEDLSVVVRIPSSALSNTLRIFRGAAIVIIAILVVASLGLFALSHKREMEERWLLEYASFHDALTNVTNRRAFEHMANNYLEEHGRKEPGALLFMDVDYFKQVNDRFGHDVGDLTLCYFADGLREIFGEEGIVARLGGDEFVVLVKHFKSKEWINEKIEQFRERLLQFHPDVPDLHDFELHCSAGIAVFPDNSTELEELMQCADNALYAVKERGRNGYEWYDNLKG